MKRRVSGLSLLYLLVAALLLVVPASAQGGVTWDSSIQVLNLSDTHTANITITYYNPDGTVALSPSDTVNPGESNTYFPIHATSGFNGSVVISSDQEVVVVSNLVANTAQKGGGSYVGFQSGASTIYFPLVMKGNAYQSTSFNVQNTGGTAADITIRFTPEAGSSYPAIPNITATIEPGAAKTYDLATISQFSAVTKWVGSVTVSVTDTANDSIAGVANTVSTRYATAYQLYTYNAFSSGSTSVVLPLIQENNSGNRTSVNCQNISSTTPTTVTITYTPETGSAAKLAQVVSSVPSNGMAVFLQSYDGTTKFVGSAVATSNPPVPMVCVVNQQRPARGTGSSYEGFDPASSTDTVVLPLIQSRNGNATNGYVYTSINLATADGLSHSITCDFKPGPGFIDPSDATGTGASVVFVQNNIYGDASKFVGGAVCTSTDGAGLFAIVNQARDATPIIPRDTLSTYNGFNR